VKPFRSIKGILPWAAIVAGITAFYCSNPVDEPPLKWRTKMEVPVTNDTFFLAQEMSKLFDQIEQEKVEMLKAGRDAAHPGKDYVTRPDSAILDTIKGDTAVFSVLRNDSTSYEMHQDSMPAKSYHPVIGAIPIKGAPNILDTLPIAIGTFNRTITIPLQKVYSIAFDSSSKALSLTLTNISSANITSLNITMFGNTQSAGALAPNETVTLLYPVALQSVDSTLNIGIQGSSPAVGAVQVRFDLNGTVASRLRVHNSLISFDTMFYNNYELTDTIDVDYIDIADGFFQYTVENHTGMAVEVQSIHDHLWTTLFCTAVKKIEKFEDIANAHPNSLDSIAYYWGFVGNDRFSPDTIIKYNNKQNIANCRLFPEWDSVRGKSISRVSYRVTKSPLQRDSIITLSKGDSMTFIIEAPTFKFREMVGSVMSPYAHKGDTQTVAIPFPWNKDSKDSLRDNFTLEKVFGDIFMTPHLPTGAYIDTFNVSYKLWPAVNTPQAICTSSTSFIHIEDKKVFRTLTDITKIVNLWPDSVRLTADLRIPRGTKIKAVNDLVLTTDPDYLKYMGRMNIKANTDVRMNAVLHWECADTANLDIGTGKFGVPKALRYFNKMDRKQFSYNLKTYNNTNVYMDIFALLAPHNLIDTLDSMSVNETWRLIQDTALARSKGFVSFFGTRGIKIPPRDSTLASNIVLNDWQIDQICGSDTCGWRWQTRFLPKSADALHDTDYLKINSWMHLEGDNNMDSLLIWKKID
jgi:hypothetical protein